MDVRFPQNMETLSSLCLIAFAFLSKISWIDLRRSVPGFSILSYSLCVCSPTTVTLWVTVATELYFPASELFWPFPFQMNLREGLFVFTKQLAEILVTMVLNLQIRLRELACLLPCLPIHEHSTPLHLFRSFLIYFISFS